MRTTLLLYGQSDEEMYCFAWTREVCVCAGTIAS